MQDFEISGGQIRISYITNFLKSRTDRFDLAQISDMRLEKRKGIATVWPPYLEFKVGMALKEYQIISKDLYLQVSRETATLTADAT